MSDDMLASVKGDVNAVSEPMGRQLGFETSSGNKGSVSVYPLAKNAPKSCWGVRVNFFELRVGLGARRMKRAGVFLFYQIIGKHKLGDPRQNATHQPQL